MEHIYIQHIKEIKRQADELARMHSVSSHAYWLHIDADKLAKCEKILADMVEAINVEKGSW